MSCRVHGTYAATGCKGPQLMGEAGGAAAVHVEPPIMVASEQHKASQSCTQLAQPSYACWLQASASSLVTRSVGHAAAAQGPAGRRSCRVRFDWSAAGGSACQAASVWQQVDTNMNGRVCQSELCPRLSTPESVQSVQPVQPVQAVRPPAAQTKGLPFCS